MQYAHWISIDFILVMTVLLGIIVIPIVRCAIANKHFFTDFRKVGPEYWGELSYGAKIPVAPSISTYKPSKEVQSPAGWAR
ncbi:MAG: hypothetical protein IT343_04210 [Candidatus Melainabacteria bacterium]|jgi:hypothetical protein|nr:hypothetical protein [Candidatus Melainabacteria bacterium]